MADLRISELAALAGADLASVDLLAVADISASETKKITVTDFIGEAITLIADATIPNAKILFTDNTVSGAVVTDNTLSGAKIANGTRGIPMRVMPRIGIAPKSSDRPIRPVSAV